MKLLLSLLASFAFALLTAVPARAELTLAVNEGVTYYVTPAEIREKYKDLADLLGKTLKTTVRIVPVDQYPVLRKGLDEQQYDLAFVHPAHLSLASMRDGKYQLVVLTKGYTEYKARFFVSKGASMKLPADMKGKRFGMPDPDSITAVITRASMRDLGIDTAKADIRTTRYQDAVPFFVENGFSDVGVSASGAVVKQWQEKGGAVLFESKPVPIKHMIASTKMSEQDVLKVRAVMLGLDKSEAGQKVLEKIGYKGYEAGDAQELATLTKWLGI
ncbi:MAG TPA: PhnD/SsuA/transferrin family substrate-binding protein [Burkholderiales bacterium]|nr:PhnD/SsuA/transferrin family substrate-binding protein [Burkholderiales bacterium]